MAETWKDDPDSNDGSAQYELLDLEELIEMHLLDALGRTQDCLSGQSHDNLHETERPMTISRIKARKVIR